MPRALSLSPYESFSPALLRSEPAALAAWIRYRMARWLIGAPLRKSGWNYTPTSTDAGTSMHVGGADGGKFTLLKEDRVVDLTYVFPGGGFEIGMPIPQTMLEMLPAPKGSAELWLQEGSGDGDQNNLEELGIRKDCVLIDLGRLLGSQVNGRGAGFTGALLLLGIKPELMADFTKLAMYTRRLAAIADAPISRHARYTPGLFTEQIPVDRLGEGGVDTRAIYEDAEFVFSHYAFRAAIFFGNVEGTLDPHSVAYAGRITNPVVDDRGMVPKPGVGPQIGNVQKAVSFALGEVGKSPSEIKKDLIGAAAGQIKDKINVTNPVLSKVVDFGLDHAGENLKDLKASAISDVTDQLKSAGKDFLVAHKDQLLPFKYPAVAVAAVAIAENKNIRNMAISAAKNQLPGLEKTVFNAAGQRLGLPSGATTFLSDNANSIVQGDWHTVAQNALANQLGGGGFANQAAAVVLEKMTGQAVTTKSLETLGAQGLKGLLDKGPVVASGKAGDAAVTGLTKNAAGQNLVSLHNGQAPSVMPHEDFVQSYDTVATPGID